MSTEYAEQDRLFYTGEEISNLKQRLKEKDAAMESMRAAAAGMRELRHQQAKTIDQQQVLIRELEYRTQRLMQELVALREQHVG